MFKNAIKNSINYTRPLLIGKLAYKNKNVSQEISTMIVLNKNGDILTTAHNADLILLSADYNETYPPILKDIKEAKPKNKKKIEKKYGIEEETIVGINTIIIDVVRNIKQLKIIKHPYLNLAVIQLENTNDTTIKTFPKFAKNIPSVGTSVCTVGFAFPEYQAFKYDEENFKIAPAYEIMNFPIFPSNGIICRNIADKKECITMFETNNIYIKGQEGGGIYTPDEQLIGMTIGYQNIHTNNNSLNLTLAINSETIMNFLDENKIEYEVSL